MNKFVGPTRCLKLVSKGFCQVKVICHNPDDLGSILKTPMVEKKTILQVVFCPHESTTETEVSLLPITTPLVKVKHD